MILRVGAWSDWPWLEHGFGTRLSERWTHQPGRSWAQQVHGATVVRVKREGPQGPADALITTEPGLLLEIRTADCLPILIVDPVRRAIAAVHAGWRGTAAGVVVAAVERMQAWCGSDPAELKAAIGPSIGPCCFEVGPEVAAKFGRQGRTFLDLAQQNAQQLRDTGVHQITVLAGCTRCDALRFHSHRRDRERAGRMEAGIRLRPALGRPQSAADTA